MQASDSCHVNSSTPDAPTQADPYETASAPPVEVKENNIPGDEEEDTGLNNGPTQADPYETASAPAVELMDNIIPGDEEKDTGDDSRKCLPFTVDPLSPGDPDEAFLSQIQWNILSISEQEAREAFTQYIASKFCYRTAPAKRMEVRNLAPLNTYRYRLVSFTETRETHLASEPYNGGFVDSPDVIPPPTPWEIMVDPPPLFSDCEMQIPVPHTYSVEVCPNCRGLGAITCSSCTGTGKKKCTACAGSGWSTQEDQLVCSFCLGSGTRRCLRCHGDGFQKCHRCSGRGILLFHTELTITWKNNTVEHVVDKNCGFPMYHLKDVTGKEIFCDENRLVYPIMNFPEPEVDDGSRACIAQHQMQFASKSRVLRQVGKMEQKDANYSP
uniref:Protein SSUH2 homolog n=1 Tax=Sphenodon punctatus TaxID=8508 RepID=A0A8D0G546_SPHPU